MLLPRDVIRYADEGDGAWRVVGIDDARVVLFDLKAKKTSLSIRPRKEVEADIDADRAEIALDHGFDARLVGDISEKQAERRDRLWKWIGPVLAAGWSAFDEAERGRLVVAAAAVAGSKVAPRTIHEALRRYWAKGMTPAALVPDFGRCGGSGNRYAKDKALGRPRAKGMPSRPHMSREIENMFAKGYRRYYRKNSKHSLVSAFRMTLADLGVERSVDQETGRLVERVSPFFEEHGLPTYRQFSYWVSKRDDRGDVQRLRKGRNRYEKDNRSIVGSAVADLLGPGSRWEIDATKFDVGLVSELHAGTYLGRPTLYIVNDVASKVIEGIYLGFEEASWYASSLAIANCVEDKVEFCRRYGVEIEPEEWSSTGRLPMRILADRGEWEGHAATAFTAKTGSTVELTEPYRGDKKGSVERRIGMVQDILRPLLPGAVTTDHREKGEDDYRREAVLTLSEAMAMVIRVVLFLNNVHELVDHPRTAQMMKDGVAAVPGVMRRWYLDAGLGQYLRANIRQTWFGLLRTGKASVTSRGLLFRSMHYDAPTVPRDWYERARKGVTPPPQAVSFHENSTNHIYLHWPDAPDGFIVCELTDHSGEYRNLSFADAVGLRTAKRVGTAVHFRSEIEERAALIRNAKAIVNGAKARRPGAGGPDIFKHTDELKRREKDVGRDATANRVSDVMAGVDGLGKGKPGAVRGPGHYETDPDIVNQKW